MIVIPAGELASPYGLIPVFHMLDNTGNGWTASRCVCQADLTLASRTYRRSLRAVLAWLYDGRVETALKELERVEPGLVTELRGLLAAEDAPRPRRGR